MQDTQILKRDDFKNDERLLRAKKLLSQVIEEHCRAPLSVKPPLSSHTESYNHLIEEFQKMRGGSLYYPYLGSGFGSGVLVELLDGSIKYDMICGVGTHFWGHCYPPLMEVALEAALQDTIMQGNLQQNKEAYDLTKLYIQASHLDHCFLSTSGAMANENALKIALQHHYPANRILAFEGCFLGRTLSLSQITDRPSFRVGLPVQLPIDYVPFYSEDAPLQSTENALNILKMYLKRYPKQHAVMCFELIQGEGGIKCGSHAFFKPIMELLKENHITIFVDEVQTFGRTLNLFATHYFELESFVDIITTGKLSHVCATLYKSHLKPKTGLLSQTFISTTAALKTSVWMLKELMQGNLFGQEGTINLLSMRFKSHFERLQKKWPSYVCGPFGVGAMIAFTPFGGESKKVSQFLQELFQAGVIAFSAGDSPMRVRFLIPAAVMTESDVDAVMDIVESVLSNMIERNV